MKYFSYEELAFMSYYNPEDGRLSMIATLAEELPCMQEELAVETARSALAKLNTITDEEFDTLDLSDISKYIV